jgi:hypothetical protein
LVNHVLAVAEVLGPEHFGLLEAALRLNKMGERLVALGRELQSLQELLVELFFGVCVELLVLLQQRFGLGLLLLSAGLGGGHAWSQLGLLVLLGGHCFDLVDYLLTRVDLVNNREKGLQLETVARDRLERVNQAVSLYLSKDRQFVDLLCVAEVAEFLQVK